MAEQTVELYTGSATGKQIDNAAAKVAAMEETLSGTAATIPSSAAVKNYVDGKSVDTESTLSGNASKIPSSKAVKDVTDTLLPKSDATFLTSKTKVYYTVFNEENTTVIEGYKYTAGDDVIVASENEKCYLVENIDFKDLYAYGRVHLAIIDDLNGTALVNRVYSRNMNPYYTFASEGQTQNYQGKKLLLYFQSGEENIYSSDYPTTNKWAGAFGVSTLSDAELLLKALEQNGKSAAIIAAYNTDGSIGDNITNALVNSSEQKNFVGSGYVGRLSLSPSAGYTGTTYRINYCPNITHLNIDVSENSSIKDVKVSYNYGLTNLRLKANNTQSISLLSNTNLQTLKLEGAYKLAQGRIFQHCRSLVRIDITNAASISVFYDTFHSCVNLEWLDMSNVPFEVPNRGSISAYTFESCSKLETLIGDHTLAEVEAGTIACFTGLKFSVNLSYCPLLSRASLLAAIKGLYDFSQDANFDAENTYATLTLGDTLSEKLEENDLDILIAKGWDFV